jgi:anti-sigma factor RsiW
MKDNRFIELVNLYVDRQISAEETAELEAELQANPRRRAVYRQYCQLHTATKQVYAGFRAHAAEPQAGAQGGRVVRAEFKSRSRLHWIHYVGGAAAAACLAVVFVRYQASQPVASVVVDASPAPAVQVVKATPTASEVTPVAVAPVPVALKLDGPATVELDYPALVRALRQDDQRAFATGELQSARLPSLFDYGVFATPSVLPANNVRVFRGKQAPTQKAEFTAFQFQR